MKKRIALVALALTCALAACSSDGSDGAEDTGTDAATTTVAPEDATTTTEATGGEATTTAATGGDDGTTGGGDCGGYTAGDGDVVRTFCDGTAVVTLTIDGVDFEIGGGTCETGGGYFTINAGVVSTDVDGGAPDYAGINLPEAPGPFDASADTVVTLTVEGVPTSLVDVSGSHDDRSATFSGTPLDGIATVTGSVTC